jgi:tetratricopeptide (TPR) repeat protein
MNRLADAEKDFRAALKLDLTNADPQTVKVRAELGAVLTDSGRAAEAVEVLDQAVKAKPDLFEAQYNLGVAHEALKHWPEAIAAYTRATKLKPTEASRATQADAQLNLAVVLRRAGRIEEAIGPAREAVQLATDRPHPHLNLGLLLSDAKRYDESVAELMAATQLAEPLYKSGATPEEREDGKQMLHKAWWRLGVVHIRREQAAQAVAALEQAKNIEATPEVLTDLGLARRKAGDLARAEVEFRAALQLNPRMQSARLHLASALAATGRCDEGLKELALLTPDPQNTETVNRIKARCDYDREMQRRAQKK